MKVEELQHLFDTGIYKITCIKNKKVYIGSAASCKSKCKSKRGFYRRWNEHIRALNLNTHANKHLQYAWNKYGESNFKFEVIEYCSSEEIESKEQYYIDLYEACNHECGFNMLNQSTFRNLTDFSAEHRKKIGDSLRGRTRPLEVIKKWSKKVQQIDRKTLKVINEFYSMAEASRITGIQRQDIGQAVIGKKIITAGGYYWKIVKDIV